MTPSESTNPASAAQSLEFQTPIRTLAVIGSRGFDTNVVSFAMDSYRAGFGRIVSGGARGVDRAAEEYGRKLGLRVTSYRPRKAFPDGSLYVVEKFEDGESVGLVCDDGGTMRFDSFAEAAKRRNWWIARDADRVLALWDGESSGTAHGIAAATRFNRDLRIWMARACASCWGSS